MSRAFRNYKSWPISIGGRPGNLTRIQSIDRMIGDDSDSSSFAELRNDGPFLEYVLGKADD
jgi:hypothetical protein